MLETFITEFYSSLPVKMLATNERLVTIVEMHV